MNRSPYEIDTEWTWKDEIRVWKRVGCVLLLLGYLALTISILVGVLPPSTFLGATMVFLPTFVLMIWGD